MKKNRILPQHEGVRVENTTTKTVRAFRALVKEAIPTKHYSTDNTHFSDTFLSNVSVSMAILLCPCFNTPLPSPARPLAHHPLFSPICLSYFSSASALTFSDILHPAHLFMLGSCCPLHFSRVTFHFLALPPCLPPYVFR